MIETLPFWQQKPRYDGADYDLTHLKPFERTMITAKGESIRQCFRFSYHCCTERPGRRDLGTCIHDPSRPEENRAFCPIRWFLSLRLPALPIALDNARLTATPGYQWILTERIPGISLPWSVWLKVMPGPPDGAMVIAVETAYLAGRLPADRPQQNFRFIVEQTRRTGAMFGMPVKGTT